MITFVKKKEEEFKYFYNNKEITKYEFDCKIEEIIFYLGEGFFEVSGNKKTLLTINESIAKIKELWINNESNKKSIIKYN